MTTSNKSSRRVGLVTYSEHPWMERKSKILFCTPSHGAKLSTQLILGPLSSPPIIKLREVFIILDKVGDDRHLSNIRSCNRRTIQGNASVTINVISKINTINVKCASVYPDRREAKTPKQTHNTTYTRLSVTSVPNIYVIRIQ